MFHAMSKALLTAQSTFRDKKIVVFFTFSESMMFEEHIFQILLEKLLN